MHHRAHRLGIAALLATALAAVACGESEPNTSSGGSGGATAASSSVGLLATSSTTSGNAKDGALFAHSPDTLYRIDPITFEVTRIGKLDCVTVTDPVDVDTGMLDIAVSASNAMVGWGAVSTNGEHGLFRIDPETAACTAVKLYPNGTGTLLPGLSYVPASLAGGATERLRGYAQNGDYYDVDAATGEQVRIGASNHGTKSPDLVSIEGDGTYAFLGAHQLTKIDSQTGNEISASGEPCTSCGFGVAYWGGRVFAFGFDGKVAHVDVKTGELTALTLTGDAVENGFRGAGVTTIAPVEIPK